MGPDGIEIEVERSEEEIRADKAYNISSLSFSNIWFADKVVIKIAL